MDLSNKNHQYHNNNNNIIEDVICKYLLPLVNDKLQSHIPTTNHCHNNNNNNQIVGAEWWVHTHPMGSNLGHQIHYDTDESILEKTCEIYHPIISSVLYLTGAGGSDEDDNNGGGGGGGCTIVFNQTPQLNNNNNNNTTATSITTSTAWLCPPKNNTFLIFPGNWLHGALPCPGPIKSTSSTTGSASEAASTSKATTKSTKAH